MSKEAHEKSQGQRLQKARIAAGYQTQIDLADALGIGKTTYHSHEKGSRGIPKNWAIRYAEILDCDLTWLLTGDGEMRPGEGSDRVLRLPASMPRPARKALQSLIGYIQNEPPLVVTMEDVALLREAVDLFFRIHHDQRPQDCEQAKAAIAGLEERLGT